MNIIYTCIIDSYDTLRRVRLEPGWRAICFTNTDIHSDSWEIVKVDKTEKIFREIKIMPHKWLPEHSKSVWIDGNLEVRWRLHQFIRNKSGFWLMTHPDRTCVYEEAKKCIELKKDDEMIIGQQMDKYRSAGYPVKNGLSATGVIIRDNTEENRKFGERWWAEVELHSRRDQLSFNFVARECGLKFHMFPFLQGFFYHRHVHQQRAIEERKEQRKRDLRDRMRGKKVRAKENLSATISINMTRTQIIQRLINNYGLHSYVEIGTQKKVNNFDKIKCNHKLSIDPDPASDADVHLTSDQYFSELVDDVTDIFFIDGLHEEDQVLRDVDNALKFLSPNGFIVLHDCNPPDELRQRVPRPPREETKQWTGDVWKAIVKLRERANIELHVVDTDWGVGVIKVGSQTPLNRQEDITYENLDKNRKAWLNLISVNEFIMMHNNNYGQVY